MGLIEGLQAIMEERERQQKATQSRDRKPVHWLSMSDGDRRYFRVLQEFDAGAPGYNPDAGTITTAVLHRSPNKADWRLKALCNYDDEGECYGCEHRLPKMTQTYIQLLEVDREGKALFVKDDEGNERLAIYLWARSINSDIVSTLLEDAEDQGTLLVQRWRLSRSGSTFKDTSYNLNIHKLESEPFDVSMYTDYILSPEDFLYRIPNDKMGEVLKHNPDAEESAGDSDAQKPPPPGEGLAEDDSSSNKDSSDVMSW